MPSTLSHSDCFARAITSPLKVAVYSLLPPALPLADEAILDDVCGGVALGYRVLLLLRGVYELCNCREHDVKTGTRTVCVCRSFTCQFEICPSKDRSVVTLALFACTIRLSP